MSFQHSYNFLHVYIRTGHGDYKNKLKSHDAFFTCKIQSQDRTANPAHLSSNFFPCLHLLQSPEQTQALRLLIQHFFSRPYGLIKDPTFINFWKFFQALRIFSSFSPKNQVFNQSSPILFGKVFYALRLFKATIFQIFCANWLK